MEIGAAGASTGRGARGAVTPARVTAADALGALRSGARLDTAIDRAALDLDARDRRWVVELVMGTLRRRAWLDAVLESRVRGGCVRLDPDVLDLLRAGLYQLLFMHSVPAYAAIAQTVELVKERHGIGASRLANAVLRRAERERDNLAPPVPADPLDAMSLEFSHPRWLVARWLARWGADATRALLAANNNEAHTIVRPFGVVAEQLESMLDSAGVAAHDIPLSPGSFALPHGVALAGLGAFQQGRCFVQDPAATLVVRYAAIPAPSTVLDLCAAPGGKSFELAQSVRTVIAADSVWTRLGRVADSRQRLDATNVWPVVSDARFPAFRPADAVLLDAPCTGTGTFRRHPDARWRLKTSDLAVMGAAQRSLLRAAAGVVKPGGLLIYSTCSLETEENDAQVETFLAEHPDFSLEPPPAGTVPDHTLDAGRLRVLPQVHGADGAFAARLRRKGA
ncbi:MAG: 16S rRNA (cytosine(967)-C(5))-methyltransferase RsmB [Gemmatimonadetes bacterium]|nr:16S rRNA (cytosine(967)-C(5))-methyltransferase RsmB [Gemmatimonadota bacterium]